MGNKTSFYTFFLGNNYPKYTFFLGSWLQNVVKLYQLYFFLGFRQKFGKLFLGFHQNLKNYFFDFDKILYFCSTKSMF